MEKTVFVLRSCASDMSSKNGFVWPETGPVSCDDWSPNKECGNGLHGLLGGVGDWNLVSFSKTSKWLVVSVLSEEVVDLGGKVKFPRGNVVFCGDLSNSLLYLRSHT